MTMKKIYMKPEMAMVKANFRNMILGSLEGLGMTISNTGASYDAESRDGGSDWEDDEY